MINVRTLKNLKNNDGLTLKKGIRIHYKTGYQVADYGYELHTAEEAIKVVRELKGDCGIWFSDGIYYIDHSFRITTKKEAIRIGREHNQISILKWKTMELIYC